MANASTNLVETSPEVATGAEVDPGSIAGVIGATFDYLKALQGYHNNPSDSGAQQALRDGTNGFLAAIGPFTKNPAISFLSSVFGAQSGYNGLQKDLTDYQDAVGARNAQEQFNAAANIAKDGAWANYWV
jgi:hypothetical protein